MSFLYIIWKIHWKLLEIELNFRKVGVKKAVVVPAKSGSNYCLAGSVDINVP